MAGLLCMLEWSGVEEASWKCGTGHGISSGERQQRWVCASGQIWIALQWSM